MAKKSSAYDNSQSADSMFSICKKTWRVRFGVCPKIVLALVTLIANPIGDDTQKLTRESVPFNSSIVLLANKRRVRSFANLVKGRAKLER